MLKIYNALIAAIRSKNLFNISNIHAISLEMLNHFAKLLRSRHIISKCQKVWVAAYAATGSIASLEGPRNEVLISPHLLAETPLPTGAFPP